MTNNDKKTALFAQKEAYFSLLEEVQQSTLVGKFSANFGANSPDTKAMQEAMEETMNFLRGKMNDIDEEIVAIYSEQQ